MAESKNSGKPGGWFPDFNYLLLALMAGTLFVTQVPFHESRPRNPDVPPADVYQANARPWQDPFEAVDKVSGNQNNPDPSKLKKIQNDIEHKIAAAVDDKGGKLEKINVVAVMLPGGVYYEDGENRRKLRYAVLSGFNAALRYMPDSSSSIQYFYSIKTGAAASYRVIYEWLVYPPTLHKQPPLFWQDAEAQQRPAAFHHDAEPHEGERRYERPPVLLLWLNNDDFSITPHQKLKDLIGDNLGQVRIGNVAVIGPFDSRILQDLVGEMAIPTRDTADDSRYRYYSPSATVEENNFLHGNALDLQQFFLSKGLKFLRITATDRDLAVAVKEELKLRGIEPSKRDRILLVGEWDSLYTWHLSNTFTGELLKKRGNKDCKSQGWDNKQYGFEEQCIFRASYLRGLDGEKPGSSDSRAQSVNNNKNSGDTKNDAIENLEEASGDSQFDYVRRLAADIGKLDAQIRHDADRHSPDSHAIKAIGILGSDVYDKLLITEALHAEFPDAVFFTNGLDARFVEPKNNEWARNMVIASSFGLTLGRDLQADIPPFRDNIQTAFFLATEMALAKQFDTEGLYSDKDLFFEKDMQSLLRTSDQIEFDKLVMPDSSWPARLFEVGRTRLFDLSTELKCESGGDFLHPSPECQDWHGIYLIALILAVCIALLSIKRSREFLGCAPGLWFVAAMATVCLAVLFGVRLNFFTEQNATFDVSMMIKLIVFALFYVCLMYFVVGSDKRFPGHGHRTSMIRNSRLRFWAASMGLVASSLGIIWGFVRPQGWLGSIETYALWDGVSLWTSQAIRFVAFILASYYIVEVSRFPQLFSRWLGTHFRLSEPENPAANSSAPFVDTYTSLLQKWKHWKKHQSRRNVLLGFLSLFVLECVVLWHYGFPNVPYRGSRAFLLNIVLLQGLLLPAALILLVLVSDASITAVKLVENCFSEEVGYSATRWLRDNLQTHDDGAVARQEQSDLHEWIGIRFTVEITRQIYDFIGFPLIIALLIVLACSSYFDNWIMPMYMKLSIGACVGWLFYWDYRLKNAADKARENALKSLRFRAIKYRGDDRTKNRSDQLERLIGMVENYDATVYKSFTQRPIFFNSLLIMIALLADSVDYYVLASKLFQG